MSSDPVLALFLRLQNKAQARGSKPQQVAKGEFAAAMTSQKTGRDKNGELVAEIPETQLDPAVAELRAAVAQAAAPAAGLSPASLPEDPPPATTRLRFGEPLSRAQKYELKNSAQGRKLYPTGADGRRLVQDRTFSLGQALDQEIARRGWQRGLNIGWVRSRWAELVGPNIAEHTTVTKYDQGILHISCTSTAWAQQLRLIQVEILQKIARSVGPNIVCELRIYGPKQPSWRMGPRHIKGRGPRDTYG